MKEIFLKNTGLKLLAVFFSMILWFFVVGEKEKELTLTVPLKFYGIKQGLSVKDNLVEEIEVTIAGPKVIIDKVSYDDIAVQIDLSGGKFGVNALMIYPEDIKTPRGIKVLKIRPTVVEVKIERQRE